MVEELCVQFKSFNEDQLEDKSGANTQLNEMVEFELSTNEGFR